MNMYRSEYSPYCAYLCLLYVQDIDTSAHVVCIRMYQMYVYTCKIHTHTYWSRIVHICAYYTYKIRTPLLIKYDNVLPSLKDIEERQFFPVQKSCSAINC